MSESRFPLRTLLLISVAVNLLIIGVAVGLAVSGARLNRGAPMAGYGPGPGAFMGALPREKSDEIRTQLEKSWTDNKTDRDAARAARIELFRLVSQEKFDEPAVRAALAKMRAADEQLTAKSQDAVINVLKDLPRRQRMAALGAILRGRGGPGAGGGPGMGAGGGPGRRFMDRRRDMMDGGPPPPPDDGGPPPQPPSP